MKEITFVYKECIFWVGMDVFKQNLIRLPCGNRLEVMGWDTDSYPPIPLQCKPYHGSVDSEDIPQAELKQEVYRVIRLPKSLRKLLR